MQTAPPAEVTPTLESAIDHAKRAFALRHYEQAVDHYATALELMTKEHGENAPEMADLYFSYGKALLENAISQSSVLGKDQGGEGADDEEEDANKAGKILSFSGDVEEDAAIDLLSQAAQLVDEEDEDGEGEAEGEDGEPEDDFNAAWEVLDLARAIYEKQKDEDEEVRLKLADTYIALGDVSLETEKFDQAITDFTAGLSLKNELLPLSSRQIAEANYKLSMVLDLTSGRLSDAIMHAQRALESVEARLAELAAGLAGTLPPVEKVDTKGKGKAVGHGQLARDDDVRNMSKAQIEAESKELSELKQDLALKVDELKTSPNDVHASAPVLAARALDQELNGTSSSGSKAPAPVNDLTSMVVRKKKKAPEPAPDASASSTTGPEKRKADEEMQTPPEKKMKLDDAQS
ncbi:hypothetical protein OF83DRAFT_41342 [Amylostereum chailletii]|nr:hypothetical protein OF83DRAFT_100210 [Amylostereum chailletii]KAI0309623.1 hypothetical protein OF83DRAFT_41342 [Amylostereum chailletii]